MELFYVFILKQAGLPQINTQKYDFVNKVFGVLVAVSLIKHRRRHDEQHANDTLIQLFI